MGAVKVIPRTGFFNKVAGLKGDPDPIISEQKGKSIIHFSAVSHDPYICINIIGFAK